MSICKINSPILRDEMLPETIEHFIKDHVTNEEVRR